MDLTVLNSNRASLASVTNIEEGKPLAIVHLLTLYDGLVTILTELDGRITTLEEQMANRMLCKNYKEE